ncbi:hypothetical protein [Enterococcus hirae]|uniref:hypothetical protein n=1 Tax=Enterococcus hirae TaxID=1354 RepID=UPI001A972F13|nr:hypothetical protein [Enterococcus hirae]MBO1117028.1 hypothetical protein [Enterococcus hirae]MBO1135006.1 hypothetical protein [Enterococcus hirae]
MVKKIISYLFKAFMAIIFLGGCTNDKKSESSTYETKNETTISSSSSSIFKEKNRLKNDKYFKNIINKDIDSRVINEISFKPSYENTEWNNPRFLVESIKIVNVENFKDLNRNNYRTLIAVKYKLLNKHNKFKHIKPSNSYIVLEDDIKIKAETFLEEQTDDFLTRCNNKTGYVHFKIKEEQKLNKIKSLIIVLTSDNNISYTYLVPVD